MQLSPTEERFILHWGEMGSRWGVNRTVAQIHALLFISDDALPADEIAETLSVARSNVSMSIKELQSWGLVQVAPVLGDRRDHFTTFRDVWQIFTTVVEERRRREIDPTLTMLRQALLEPDAAMRSSSRERMQELLDFIELVSGWHDDVRRLPRGVAMGVMKLGAGIGGLVRGAKADSAKD